MLTIKPIRSDADYRAALRLVSPMFDNPPTAGSAEEDQLDVMITLIEAYETKHFPRDLPDPVEAIKFRMEQSGMTARDLVPIFGRLNRVYEVLNRVRPLSLAMIRNLHEQLGIPLEPLMQRSSLDVEELA